MVQTIGTLYASKNARVDNVLLKNNSHWDEQYYLFPINDSVSVHHLDGTLVLYSPLYKNFLVIEQCLMNVLEAVQSSKKLNEHNFFSDKTRDFFKMLVQYGFLKNVNAKDRGAGRSHPSLFLIPTTQCNLRCIYCYSEAGDVHIETMPSSVYRKAIDSFVKKHYQNQSKLNLVFHGGGEPTTVMNILEDAGSYFKNKCNGFMVTPEIQLSSNGVFSQRARDFIINNKVQLQISMDGIEEIQNKQRPRAGGQESYSTVIKNIKYLEQRDTPIAIRSTVTSGAIGSMMQVVQLAHELKVDLLHFEPAFASGRGRRNSDISPDLQYYSEQLISCLLLGEQLGLRVSASDLSVLFESASHFCGACGSNCVISPSGNISTCQHILSKKDKGAELFLIGDVKTNIINSIRLKNLEDRTVENMPGCKDCFIKHTCAGDCLFRVYEETGDIYNTERANCKSRRLLGEKIISLIVNQDLFTSRVEKKEFRLNG